ncbi:MAG: T9SS type A sorting domain-containing protein, partial [Paludibacteraceae bacterium]|nr:T9SS type A sorting domain-containing protein [Paludibacteraceae bacterium]
CSKFVDESVAVMGILDAGFVNQGETSIILRSENDILATTYTFNTLEEMKAAGQPLATGVTYVLDNNVLVTHVHSWIIKDLDLTIYGMFVQDETGGLYIQTQSKINFVAGDSIKGISGTYHAYENEAPYLDLKSVASINKLSSDNLNSIEYEEVTMEDLSINPEKYASRVVKLMGVGHGSRQINNQGTMENQKFLYQGQDTMVYEIWDYTLYEYNNIVGVFDYGSYRSFSIIPLSQNHIEKGKYIGTDIENNQVINTISIQEDNLFAPNAIAINIYDINGKILKSAHNDNINISNLNHGIYIIKVVYDNNSIYTSKIIK